MRPTRPSAHQGFSIDWVAVKELKLSYLNVDTQAFNTQAFTLCL